MTVAQLVKQELSKNPSYKDCGNYHLNGGRLHTVLQSNRSRKIILIYEPTDEEDPANNAKVNVYDNILELFKDHPLDSSLNP